MFDESRAIAIRKVRFSESSLILTWLTPAHGKLQTSARGVLKPGGPLSGRVDVFHETFISWACARKGEVHSLREAEVLWRYEPFPPAHLNLQTAAYFSALVEITAQPGEPAPAVYELLLGALRYLQLHSAMSKTVFHFERRLASSLGILNEKIPAGAASALLQYAGSLPKGREELLGNLDANPPASDNSIAMKAAAI